MSGTANLKFDGVHGNKYPYLALLLTSNLLLVVHISQTQPEDTEQERLVNKAVKGQPPGPWLVYIAQLIGASFCKPKGNIHIQFPLGTCLGCRLSPRLGAYNRQPIEVSLLH